MVGEQRSWSHEQDGRHTLLKPTQMTLGRFGDVWPTKKSKLV